MIRNLLIGALVALVTLSTTSTAYALVNVRETTESVTDTVEATVDDTAATVKSVEDRVSDRAAKVLSLDDRIAERKAELERRLAAKAEERKERLEGRRLERCQNRQESINKLINKSAETGQRHLQNIQRVEQRVEEFATKKSISSDAYGDAQSAADDKEAAASAAVSVLDAQTFDCSTVDSMAPASDIRTVREAKRAALREYRDSVIELIKVVKAEFAAQQTTSTEQNGEER